MGRRRLDTNRIFSFSAFCLVLLPPIVLSEKGHNYIAAFDSREQIPDQK